jgi:hypothetical protein
MSNQYNKITIIDCQKLAQSKNGKCLSDVYVNAKTPLSWECEFGHQFVLAWKHIQYYKSWCNRCDSNVGEEICRTYFETIFCKPFVSIRPNWLKYSKYNLQLDGYCGELNIAFEHNGTRHNKLHSYFHADKSNLDKQIARDNFKIQKCKELGIRLIIVPEIFREIKLADLKEFIINECEKMCIELPSDTCNVSIDLSKVNNITNKLARYKSLAKEKNGECLSDAYISFHEPLVWKCNENHIWQAAGFSIDNGTWCPLCAGLKKLSIEDAYLVASKKGGACLSKKYVSAQEKLEWQCVCGHIWCATMASVRNIGTWCPKCRIRRQKITERIY